MSLLKNLSIHFVVPYPIGIAPGQRFRFEQYLKLLHQKGYMVSILSFLSMDTQAILYTKGNHLKKLLAVLSGLIKRILLMPSLAKADIVFIFREAAPIGPPIFEWIIAKVLRKKIIYDFDDAIWLSDRTDEGSLEKMIRWRSKVALICKWSHVISCGNDYLARYARQFNNRVTVNPTTIDMDRVNVESMSVDCKTNKIIIGWTGSHSTLKYLERLEGVLQQLEKAYPQVKVLVIADRQPSLRLSRMEFVKWNKETEIKDLISISIGIMPLPDDEWTKGKCGFKALQYMALGIPTVASPVGVNTKIIQHGHNGLLAQTPEEWFSSLQRLILDREERSRLGQAGRKTVEDHYSVSSNEANFLSLFS